MLFDKEVEEAVVLLLTGDVVVLLVDEYVVEAVVVLLVEDVVVLFEVVEAVVVLFEAVEVVVVDAEVVELVVLLVLLDRVRVQDEDLVYLDLVLVDDDVEDDVVVGLTHVLVVVGKGGHRSSSEL